MKHYFLQVLIALDQLVNALVGGWADETLSSRAYRAEGRGKLAGRILRPTIDLIARLFGDRNHCKTAFLTEGDRAQLPPAFRERE